MIKKRSVIGKSRGALDVARHVLETEVAGLQRVRDRLDRRFDVATQMIASCKGKLIVVGMGKSGLVGRKMSATFSSTLTPSTFMHPVEAYHGDFGMVSKEDLVLMISNSGKTKEVIRLIEPLVAMKVPIIALCGDMRSALAQRATCTLDVGVATEASLTGTVVTASALVTMAMGDALAIAVMEERGVSEMDLERVHPDGTLGKKMRGARRR